VKIRGHRIELGEIESVLAEHAAVREAVVVAREDGAGDRRLVAYAVPRDGARPDAPQLRRFLEERLPDHMVPAAFVFLDSFPLTPNRKVDRKALPAPDAAERRDDDGYEPPVDELEEAIAGIWREVLHVSKVGTRDNFFDLGGHSISAVQVHGKLKKHFGRDLALTDLFRYPTVRALAEFLRGGAGRDGAAGTAAGQSRGQARKDSLRRRQLLEKRRAARET
jgi:acyl carrier protein